MKSILFHSIVLLMSLPGQAAIYRFDGPPNVVAIPLQDSYDDLALKIEAIDQAKDSIDIITYLQTDDEFMGEPLLRAIERAIDRGVRVRYIMEWLPNTVALGVRAGAPAKRLLRRAYTSKNCGVKVQCLTPMAKIFAGFTPTDNFHEKGIFIDVGTMNERAFVCGRNNNDFAARDLDFAVAFRRLDPKKNSAISLLAKNYDAIWEQTLQIQEPKKTSKNRPLPRKKAQDVSNKTTPLFSKIKDCFFSSKEIKGISLRPTNMTVTTNDFFRQLKSNSWFTLTREGKMKSDNIKALEESIKSSKNIRMSLMSTMLPETLKAALKTALANGASIEIFTNSAESDSMAVPGSASYYYSARDWVELMEWSNSHPPSRLRINTLSSSDVSRFPKFWERVRFVHQKMVLTDSHLYFGSDNYNQASLLKNSEMQVILEGEDVMKYFHHHFNEISALFKPLQCSELIAAKEKSKSVLNRVIIAILRPFF